MAERMTKEEFKSYYAKGAGLPADWLERWGAECLPCDCGAAGCKGWRIAIPSKARAATPKESADD